MVFLAPNIIFIGQLEKDIGRRAIWGFLFVKKKSEALNTLLCVDKIKFYGRYPDLEPKYQKSETCWMIHSLFDLVELRCEDFVDFHNLQDLSLEMSPNTIVAVCD